MSAKHRSSLKQGAIEIQAVDGGLVLAIRFSSGPAIDAVDGSRHRLREVSFYGAFCEPRMSLVGYERRIGPLHGTTALPLIADLPTGISAFTARASGVGGKAVVLGVGPESAFVTHSGQRGRRQMMIA